jgi:hypothetical protein
LISVAAQVESRASLSAVGEPSSAV